MRMPDRFDVITTVLLTLAACTLVFGFPLGYLHDAQVASEREASVQESIYTLHRINRTLLSMKTHLEEEVARTKAETAQIERETAMLNSVATGGKCRVGDRVSVTNGPTYVCVRADTWRHVP